MSTIKATNIQPQSDSDPLVFSTNATERMRIPSSGEVSITGGATVSGGLSITGGATVYGDIEVYNGAFVRSGGLSVTGSASISQNMTVGSNLTVGSSTLSTPSGSAPLFGARAWGIADPTATPLRSGGNCTCSFSAGVYTVTLTTPMSDANYAVVSTANFAGNFTAPTIVNIVSSSQFTIRVYGGTDNLRSNMSVSWVVFA